MSLLLPVFLGAGVLIGLPLLLHLLRIRPRQNVPFPSLAFLGKEALRDSNRHRIRRWLVLLLRCMVILMIAMAFTRPYWKSEHATEGRAVVVVVDNSYSMQAAGRREAVQAWLSPQLAGLRPSDQLGVLLLHPTPTWFVPLGENLDAGRKALADLPTGYETTRYRAGIELAGAKLALSSPKKKEIWLAADQQRIGWNGVRFEQGLPPGVELLSAPALSAPKRQAGIVSLKVSRTLEGRGAFAATVRSFSRGRDERVITFFAGGEKVGTQRCILEEGRSVTVHADFEVPAQTGALMLHATIDSDELTIDDSAYAALAPADDRRVILAAAAAGAEVDFLALALTSVRGEKLPVFRVDPLPSGSWDPGGVAVLRGPSPFQGEAVTALERFLAAGGSAWMICDGSQEQIGWLAKHGVGAVPAKQPAGGRLKLRDLALEHPVFASFAGHSLAPLLAPSFRRGWALQSEEIEPLARWNDRTVAIAEVALLGGRLLVTGFGDTRADSTFPIESGYVPFVHQAVNWLAESQSVAPVGCRVGETLLLPGAGTWRSVLSPATVAPIEANGHVTPTAPGLYLFEQLDRPKRYYAVNLDPAESDLAPWPTPQDFNRLVRAGTPGDATSLAIAEPSEFPNAVGLFDERHAWWWLMVAAVFLLLAELTIANRTVL